jgi:hypothetical protein
VDSQVLQATTNLYDALKNSRGFYPGFRFWVRQDGSLELYLSISIPLFLLSRHAVEIPTALFTPTLSKLLSDWDMPLTLTTP